MMSAHDARHQFIINTPYYIVGQYLLFDSEGLEKFDKFVYHRDRSAMDGPEVLCNIIINALTAAATTTQSKQIYRICAHQLAATIISQ